MSGILDSFRLDGQVALVTGAAQGLGQAIAVALAEAGAHVAALDLNEAGATATAATIAAIGRCSAAIAADVASAADLPRVVAEVEAALGPVDILVNSAGISRVMPSLEMSQVDWDQVLEVNLSGLFRYCQAFGRGMAKQGHGRIISLSSMSALIVNRDVAQAPYYASKAGVSMLTKALAAELAPRGVTVNAIAPGYMRTPLNTRHLSDPARAAEWENNTPLGRIGEAQDVAGAVVFLASPAASFVTGHTLVVDGGFTLW